MFEGNCRNEILSNAKVTEENYFVAPPGNIPLETSVNVEPEVFTDKKDDVKNLSTNVTD